MVTDAFSFEYVKDVEAEYPVNAMPASAAPVTSARR